MSVIRVNKTSNYTVMSNYHFKEKDMSLKAKGLLSLMLSLPDDWNYTVAGLVSICKENETAIKSALKELSDFGYVRIDKVFPNESNDGRISYVYNIFEVPEKQGTKKQGVENLPLEIQYVENPIQLNTNKSNTKKENTNINNSIINNTKTTQELEEDTTITKPTKKQKKNRYDQCLDIIDAFVLDNHFGQDIKNALISYLDMRLQMSTIYANQWKGLLNRLLELSTDHKVVIKIINQSITKGWASFYELKEYNTGSYQKTKVFSEQGVSSNPMTSEDFEKERSFQEQLRQEGKQWKF